MYHGYRMTFFLQFFPELIREGHLYILQTPLFRVRTRKQTDYCFDEEEKEASLKALGKKAEITRFKGRGEISSHEFKFMIGSDMRLDPVRMERGGDSVKCYPSTWVRIPPTARTTLSTTCGRILTGVVMMSDTLQSQEPIRLACMIGVPRIFPR